MPTEEERLARRKEYQRRYRAMQTELYRDAFSLTPEEKLKMGLIKKPSVLKGTIQIVIPVHYGSKGVTWESRFVTENQLEMYAAQYPSMQILDERYRVRRKDGEQDG